MSANLYGWAGLCDRSMLSTLFGLLVTLWAIYEGVSRWYQYRRSWVSRNLLNYYLESLMTVDEERL